MTITLPTCCPRGLDNCKPLSQVVSEEKDATFVCCGLSTEESRSHAPDCFRHCFKTHNTDTRLDYDRIDMLDTIRVMAETMALATRMANDTA